MMINNSNMVQNIKLSKTIHLLGEILGFVIKEQEGISIFNKIEKIRVLSKASRGKKDKKEINIGGPDLLSQNEIDTFVFQNQ